MRVDRNGNLSTGGGFLVAEILDCGGAGVLANSGMVPSPGVSGGEESGMKANGLLVAAGAESTSSKRQRRPSVRLGEPSDHPASNILQNPPKRRRVQEEEEEGDEEEVEREKEEGKEKGEQEQEREEDQEEEEEEEREKDEEKEREELELEDEEEQATRKMEWEGVPDQEREERERYRDGYHDVPVQGDFPFSGKVMHVKPRTRTLEHVASTASQSQRQRDAAVLAAGSGEPGLSSKESDGEGPGAAVEQQQANGEQASEQGLALALVVAEEKPVTGRRQQVGNGPAKRGKATRRGGRRGGASASYKSIGGMLQASKKGQEEKVSKAGKAGRPGRAGKAGKDKEKEAKQVKERREGREVKEDKDSKASETESVKNPSVDERQGREALPPLPLPLSLSLLPPPPVPLAILPPPAASDKERESSDRGPLSSDATQSSFNEQGNGEAEAPNGGPQQQQQQHGELQREKTKTPLPLPLATRSPAFPPPETNGGKRDGRVKSTDGVTAVRQEGPRADQPELTVGELSTKYLHRAAGAYASGVRPWLSALGLGHHAEVFEQNEVDDEVLPLLTMEDLTEMRIPIGPKRKMFNAIQVLRDSVL